MKIENLPFNQNELIESIKSKGKVFELNNDDEILISKIASIFQLAMKAYEYLEKPNLKKKFIRYFK